MINLPLPLTRRGAFARVDCGGYECFNVIPWRLPKGSSFIYVGT
jgi:hypothetical protein